MNDTKKLDFCHRQTGSLAMKYGGLFCCVFVTIKHYCLRGIKRPHRFASIYIRGGI